MFQKIVCISLIICLFIVTFLWFNCLHKEALQSAENQAALRILSEFQCDLISEKQINANEYLEKLRVLQKEYEDFALLQDYVYYVGQKAGGEVVHPPLQREDEDNSK